LKHELDSTLAEFVSAHNAEVIKQTNFVARCVLPVTRLQRSAY